MRNKHVVEEAEDILRPADPGVKVTVMRATPLRSLFLLEAGKTIADSE
jgi:hypothetical protein